MSEERVQYKFMMPASLKVPLEQAAERSRRSLSAEIVERLEWSLEAARDLESLHHRIAELEAALSAARYEQHYQKGMAKGVMEVLKSVSSLAHQNAVDPAKLAEDIQTAIDGLRDKGPPPDDSTSD